MRQRQEGIEIGFGENIMVLDIAEDFRENRYLDILIKETENNCIIFKKKIMWPL